VIRNSPPCGRDETYPEDAFDRRTCGPATLGQTGVNVADMDGYRSAEGNLWGLKPDGPENAAPGIAVKNTVISPGVFEDA
jgi:hypothetical protein